MTNSKDPVPARTFVNIDETHRWHLDASGMRAAPPVIGVRPVWISERRAQDFGIIAALLRDMNLPGLAGSLVMTCEAWDAAPADSVEAAANALGEMCCEEPRVWRTTALRALRALEMPA